MKEKRDRGQIVSMKEIQGKEEQLKLLLSRVLYTHTCIMYFHNYPSNAKVLKMMHFQIHLAYWYMVHSSCQERFLCLMTQARLWRKNSKDHNCQGSCATSHESVVVDDDDD